MEKDLDRLPLSDRATAEALKDELVDLKDNRAYQLVLARLEARRQRDLRLLVKEADTLSLRKLQGRVEALEETLNIVPEMLREINETNLPEET